MGAVSTDGDVIRQDTCDWDDLGRLAVCLVPFLGQGLPTSPRFPECSYRWLPFAAKLALTSV